MWPVFIFGGLATLIAIWEVPAMIKKGHKRELFVFALLLLVGSVLNIAHFLRVPVKNPVEWLYKLYTPVSDFFLQFLQ